MVINVKMNPCFKEFNKTKARYRLAVGSAGSGKSMNIALDYILKLSDPKYEGANLLVVRQTETSHKDSTFAELKNAIYKCGLNGMWGIKENPLYMHNNFTGSSILFRGFSDERARERVKSISVTTGKLTGIGAEEACELQRSDLNICDDRLRGELPDNLYYQITMSTNPVNASSFIKTDFGDGDSPNVFKSHTTYLDNRFLDDDFKKRMERRKEIDPEGYKVYGLGEGGETSGLILKNYEVKDNLRYLSPINDINIHYAQDFGFNHANCILELGFKDDDIYVLSEIYVHEKDTAEIIQIAEEKGIIKSKLMYCDSAEPDRIQMGRKAGFKAVPVKKEPGSVKAQIDYLKQHRIYIDGSCINTIKEIQAWKGRKDKVSGEYLDEPVDIFDDAMACLRYGVEPYRRSNKLKLMDKKIIGL